jgi:uncharacterized membrane protein YGL010W
MAARTGPTAGGPRRIDVLLGQYGESHQNPANKLIHWFAVPVIAWSILAFLRLAPFPESLRSTLGIDWAVLLAAAAVVYYRSLSTPLALGMAAFCIACFLLTDAVVRRAETPLFAIAAVLFIVAWAFQFLGHWIEGKRTSFVDDLRFLLIGPAWLLSDLYRRLGIRY